MNDASNLDAGNLASRLARIEAQLAIQQLASRYAVAIDSRDVDTWLNLFIDDVDCGRRGKGREALRGWIDPGIRTFYRSVHQICGHVIDLIDEDRATGKVYCRAEHEDRGKWYVMAICYFDRYARRNGHWFFVQRTEKHWYSTDTETRPTGPNFQRWEAWSNRKPMLPHDFPTWNTFWEKSDPALIRELSAEP